MPTPTWLEKASAEVKEAVVRMLNGQRVDGVFSQRLPAIALWNEYVFVKEHLFQVPVGSASEKYRLRARHGKRFASISEQLKKEDDARNAIHSQLRDIESWRNGSALLPSIIRRCRYERCSRFFLVPTSRPVPSRFL